MVKSIKKELLRIYDDFFKSMNIDKETGILKNLPEKDCLKFQTYPYIGSKYGQSKKILFVGLDIGADEKIQGIQNFEERRKAIEEVDVSEHNPHIAGTYVCALYFIKEEKNWQDYWNKIKNAKTCNQALKEKENLPKEDPLSYVALTNYFKFVTPKRRNRGHGKDRRHIDKEIENRLFLREVEVFDPDMIIFQSKSFEQLEIIPDLYKTTKTILIGPHPAYRGKREPEYFIKQLKSV